MKSFGSGFISLKDFDYSLPEELIAQYPAASRGESRMLAMNRHSGKCEIRGFSDIIDYLKEGDCVVTNNTKVIKARLFGIKKASGGKIEALLIRPLNETKTLWKCLLRPGKRVHTGTLVKLLDKSENILESLAFKVVNRNDDGTFLIDFSDSDTNQVQQLCGHVPLPPYIKRTDQCFDSERYQTIYAKVPGAVAAPTAGLHFTPEIFAKLAEKNIKMTEITLHVGPGTFLPVGVENIKEHKMHSEEYSLSEESANIINRTKKSGGRILAVGTTSVRVLETCADGKGFVKASGGETDIFLYPPNKPEVADMLFTNFHLPKSTLLMLVCAFADREKVLAAYEIAKSAKFHFYSYGDSMLIF